MTYFPPDEMLGLDGSSAGGQAVFQTGQAQLLGASYNVPGIPAYVRSDLFAGPELVPMFFKAAIDLRKGVLLGLDPTFQAVAQPNGSTAPGDVRADGIAIGFKGTHIYEFQWGIHLMPASFWALTTKYKQFKINKISLRVTPKPHQRYQAAAANDGLVNLSSVVSGVASALGSYTKSSLPGVAATLITSAAGLNSFETTNPIFAHYDTTVYKFEWSKECNSVYLQGQHWRLWNRLNLNELRYFPGFVTNYATDPVHWNPQPLCRYDMTEMIERSGAVICENQEFSQSRQPMVWKVVADPRPLHAPFNTGGSAAQQSLAQPDPYVTSAVALRGFETEPMGWIPIPPGGYTCPGAQFNPDPAQAPANIVPIQPDVTYSDTIVSNAASAAGLASMLAGAVTTNNSAAPASCWTPFGQMIVRAHDWPCPWPGAWLGASNWGLLRGSALASDCDYDKVIQCFRPSQDDNPLRPTMLNPPLMWDVTYVVDVTFTGANAHTAPYTNIIM